MEGATVSLFVALLHHYGNDIVIKSGSECILYDRQILIVAALNDDVINVSVERVNIFASDIFIRYGVDGGGNLLEIFF